MEFLEIKIAKGNQIDAGTVSVIIKQCKQQEQLQEYADGGFEFDLIRGLAVMLKREGLDVNSFASSIRLQRKLDEKSLSEERIELFYHLLRTLMSSKTQIVESSNHRRHKHGPSQCIICVTRGKFPPN
jgi:hypothetical protein